MRKYYFMTLSIALVSCGVEHETNGTELSLDGVYVNNFNDGQLNVTAHKGVVVEIQDGNLLLSGGRPNAKTTGKTDGAFLTLDTSVEEQLAGKLLTISFVAKSTDLAGLKVAYSTFGNGNSGWKEFKLGPKLQVYSFQYRVSLPKKPGKDYIGFLPVNGKVQLTSIGIELKD